MTPIRNGRREPKRRPLGSETGSLVGPAETQALKLIGKGLPSSGGSRESVPRYWPGSSSRLSAVGEASAAKGIGSVLPPARSDHRTEYCKIRSETRIRHESQEDGNADTTQAHSIVVAGFDNRETAPHTCISEGNLYRRFRSDPGRGRALRSWCQRWISDDRLTASPSSTCAWFREDLREHERKWSRAPWRAGRLARRNPVGAPEATDKHERAPQSQAHCLPDWSCP